MKKLIMLTASVLFTVLTFSASASEDHCQNHYKSWIKKPGPTSITIIDCANNQSITVGRKDPIDCDDHNPKGTIFCSSEPGGFYLNIECRGADGTFEKREEEGNKIFMCTRNP